MSSSTEGDRQCREILEQLDAFLDQELPEEAGLAIATHLAQCARCACEADARRLLRGRLRSAVHGVEPPLNLETRIRTNLNSTRRLIPWLLNLGLVTAGLLALAFSILAYQRGHLRWTAASQEDYIASISSRVVPVMRIGLSDHVHCAVFRKYPKNPPSIAQCMHEIGPQYSGVIPIVREGVPGDFQIWLAHHCTFHDRQFVHMVLRGKSGMLSVVIARKRDGEDLQGEGVVPQVSESGIATYLSSVQRFQIAAFENRDHMVYVISDLPASRNMEIMQAVAPSLETYLGNLES